MKTLITLLGIAAMLCSPMSMEAKKKEKAKEVPQLLNFPSSTIGEYRLHGGKVVLRTRIIVPDELKKATEEEQKQAKKQIAQFLNSRSLTAYIRNYLVHQEGIKALTFDDDCAINTTLDIPYPMFVLVSPLGEVYMCPGDTVDISINMQARTREEACIMGGTGPSGEINNVMNEVKKKYLNQQAYSSYRISEASQIDSLLMWKDAQVAAMDSMVIRMNDGLPELTGCSPLTSDIVRSRILAWYFTMISDSYNTYMNGEYDKKEYRSRYFDFIVARQNYLTNNPIMMISADEFFFNRMEFGPFEPIMPRMLSWYPAEYDPVKDAEYNDSLQTLRKTIPEGMNIIREQMKVTPYNFTSQVCLMRHIFYALDHGFYGEDNDVKAEQVANIMNFISNPDLMRVATFAYRNHIRKHEAQNIENKVLTKGDSIFNRIIQPYKGNVLNIDFWSMSCGPCRGGMLRDREDVEQYKDKPVKFLYVTNDKPEVCNRWMDENKIKGEHIFITSQEWSLLQEKFSFSGIPFHVIVDNNGNVQPVNTDYRTLIKTDM